MFKLFGLIFGLLLSYTCNCQEVETILSFPTITDGMCVDKLGNVYTTSGGLAGTTVGQYDLGLEVFVPSYIMGLVGPTDVDFLNDSILIITNYDVDLMSSYNFNTDELLTIAEGFDGPAGIAIDGEQNIFVANWGNAPAYAGHTINKINAAGDSWVYIDSSLLYRPQAIAFNHEGVLIVHSNSNLYEIDPSDSTLHLWVELPAGVANMVFREKDSCLYGASVGANQILKIDALGNATIFAGSSAGYEDGDVADAKFTNPLGITFSPGEDTLYVSEGGGVHRLRRIIMTDFSLLEEGEMNGENLYPNPLHNGQDLRIENSDKKNQQLAIYDMNRQLVYTYLVNNEQDIIVPSSVFINQPSGTYLLVMSSEDGEKRRQTFILQ